jgi:hypothetical protein
MLGRTEDRQREIDKRGETGTEERREGRPGDRQEGGRQAEKEKERPNDRRTGGSNRKGDRQEEKLRKGVWRCAGGGTQTNRMKGLL